MLDGLRVIVRYGGLQVSNGGGQVALGLLQGGAADGVGIAQLLGKLSNGCGSVRVCALGGHLVHLGLQGTHGGNAALQPGILAVDSIGHRLGGDQANHRSAQGSRVHQHRQPYRDPFAQRHDEQADGQLRQPVDAADSGNGEPIKAALCPRVAEERNAERRCRHRERRKRIAKAQPEHRRFGKGNQKHHQQIQDKENGHG